MPPVPILIWGLKKMAGSVEGACRQVKQWKYEKTLAYRDKPVKIKILF
jgi:hypothetical protein